MILEKCKTMKKIHNVCLIGLLLFSIMFFTRCARTCALSCNSSNLKDLSTYLCTDKTQKLVEFSCSCFESKNEDQYYCLDADQKVTSTF